MRCLRCPHPVRRHSPLGCLVVGCRCASQENGAGTVTLRGVLAAALAVLVLSAAGCDGLAVKPGEQMEFRRWRCAPYAVDGLSVADVTSLEHSQEETTSRPLETAGR